MARKNVNLALDVEVYESLDEFASLAGINRSAAANLLLKGLLLGNPKELYQTMISATWDKRMADKRLVDGGLLSQI